MRDSYKILIWGGGGKARIILRMLEELYGNRASVLGIYDPYISSLSFSSEVPHCSSADELADLIEQSTHFVVCIGAENGFARYAISEKLSAFGLSPLPIISRHSILDDLDGIGEGLQAMPGSIVHKFSTIGHYCILNTNSTVDHECRVGNGVHVMGGAAIAGRVDIGDYSTIGTNATVLPDVKIGRNVFVGAGAVVINNIADGVVVAGVPSRVIRRFEPTVDLSVFSVLKPGE